MVQDKKISKGKLKILDSVQQESPSVNYTESVLKKMDIRDIRPLAKEIESMGERKRGEMLKKLEVMDREQIHHVRKKLKKQKEDKSIRGKEYSEREVKVIQHTDIAQTELQKLKKKQREDFERTEREKNYIDKREKAIEELESKREVYREEYDREREEEKNEKHQETKHEKVVGIVVATELGAVAISKAIETEEHALENMASKTEQSVDMSNVVTQSENMYGEKSTETAFPSFDELTKRAMERYQEQKNERTGMEHKETKEDVKVKDDEIVRERTTTSWGNY